MFSAPFHCPPVTSHTKHFCGLGTGFTQKKLQIKSLEQGFEWGSLTAPKECENHLFGFSYTKSFWKSQVHFAPQWKQELEPLIFQQNIFFFPRILGLEEWSFWICTVPTPQQSNPGSGTAGFWDMGAVAACQEDPTGQPQVPCSLLWECCWLLNSYLLLTGGQIPAPTGQEELLSPLWMKSCLEGSRIHGRAAVEAPLQPRGSKGKSTELQLGVPNRGS